ncbi:hypothetical protein MWU31_21830 [Aeromonas hydrophila]|uniref:hypothetical protein n=1 Tax=Aeromonas hydrophila TaxID=644 RepID=UPI001FF39959|nr:hypothetical protein [Aeromonas hydrophila]MCK0187866.1 hypothetical protein [Aeromonas hydrophila]UOV94546.1 hypothetical protein MUW98_24280 [Aeromonas hydrophila]
MANPYSLLLKSGASLEIAAIWDTSQQEAKVPTGSSNPRGVRVASEQGVLTVLQNRLRREDVMGAEVETPLGRRWVVDLDYTDATTTVLMLGLAGDANLPAGSGPRFSKTTI